MPKMIDKVSMIIRRAMRAGESRSWPYDAGYKNGQLSLFHYNTLIFRGRKGQLLEVGGYSVSDQNAIYTAMREMDIEGNVIRARGALRVI